MRPLPPLAHALLRLVSPVFGPEGPPGREQAEAIFELGAQVWNAVAFELNGSGTQALLELKRAVAAAPPSVGRLCEVLLDRRRREFAEDLRVIDEVRTLPGVKAGGWTLEVRPLGGAVSSRVDSRAFAAQRPDAPTRPEPPPPSVVPAALAPLVLKLVQEAESPVALGLRELAAGAPLPPDTVMPTRDAGLVALNEVQRYLVAFAEGLLMLPPLRALRAELQAVEDALTPAGPPLSPITRPHFLAWAYCDHAFGPAAETLAALAVGLTFTFGATALSRSLAELAASRLGLWRVVGVSGDHTMLRELCTDGRARVVTRAGYRGRAGEVWLTRVLPDPTEPAQAFLWSIPHVFGPEQLGEWQRWATGLGAAALVARMKQSWLDSIRGWAAGYGPDVVFLRGAPAA